MAASQTSSPGKLDAMSRALGAAFLNHQVEKLEQTVSESRTLPRNFGPKAGREWKRTSPTRLRDPSPGMDCDLIITDASLLIHALSFVQHILHPSGGRKGPVVVVPLEALNTLDLLKKGSSNSAKRAREASRLLEREVGENPQIRIQAETEYVGWDAIAFKADADGVDEMQSPEWVRRTVCCGMWEKNTSEKPKMVMAVCTTAHVPSGGASPPSAYAVKNDFKANGTLITHWSKKAGIEVLDVPADPLKPPAPSRREKDRSSSETERPAPVKQRGGRGGARLPVDTINPPYNPAFKTIKTRYPEGSSPNRKGVLGSFDRPPPGILTRPGGGKGLVDKPPNPLGPAMQGKVIRVLARGEKLNPDD